MDLQLTRRGDYTIRAAVSLARTAATGGYRKLREIADEMEIPERYTHEIVTLLVKAGMAEGLAGKQGGFRLVKDPSDIKLLDIIEAAEGSLRLDRCALTGGPCHWQQRICAVHPMLDDATRALTESLATPTLSDVLAMDQRLQLRDASMTAAGKSPASGRPSHRPGTSEAGEP